MSEKRSKNLFRLVHLHEGVEQHHTQSRDIVLLLLLLLLLLRIRVQLYGTFNARQAFPRAAD